MAKDIELIELFSGIGGFAKGFEDAGFNIVSHKFSEVDNHAIANYKFNFPNAQHIGSVTGVHLNRAEKPTVLTFGSPCQDFSVAGKQLGFAGNRSVLILEALRIIGELQPSVFIWENVKGCFSSNKGKDFWAIISAFAQLRGYRIEWQLLNTKWFLPQNRERLYLVGHLADRSRLGVFPFREDDQIFNHQKGRHDANTKPASTITNKPHVRKESNYVVVAPTIAACLTQGGNSGGLHSDMPTIEVIANTAKGFDEAKLGDSINFSVPNSTTRRGRIGHGCAQTLDTGCKQGVISIMEPRSFHNKELQNGEVCHTILGHWGTGGNNVGLVVDPVSNIRRLTEIECERLQGFNDDWTKFGIYPKKVWINKKEKTFTFVDIVKQIPKTQRYKLCGNAVTTNVVKAIAERLVFL
jgi:DNA (cytosine-5)-methyltransferase 1